MSAMPSMKSSHKIRRAKRILLVKKGADVVYRGAAARVEAVCSESKILLKISGTEQPVWASADELSGYQSAPGPTERDASCEVRDEWDQEDMDRAKQWLDQFRRLVVDDQLSPSSTDEISELMAASTRTVRRHLERYLADPCLEGQLPYKPGPEKGVLRLSSVREAVIQRAIDECYEAEERGTITATKLLAGALAVAANIKPPSRTAVRSRVLARDRWRAARKRHGRVRGDAIAKPAGMSLRVDRPLDFVQMDHAIVDVILVDQVTREEIGRPWITLAIDVATRCVLGFYLTLDDPSQTSVALALESACCPKDGWLKELGYVGEWRPFGLMKAIGWDNAKCFKNTSLCSTCRQFGIEPKPRRVRTPTHGAHIERFIGTYMGKVHLLKGTTFSNTKDREDYNSQGRAVMTLAELIKWTVHQINGVYHNTFHSSLKMTPLQAWNRVWVKNGVYEIPPFPADRRYFRLSLLPGIFRTVQREGIGRFNFTYWDEALTTFIRDGKKYWVAHDPRNVSKVYLRHNDIYIDVAWKDRTQPPAALFEVNRAKKELKEINGSFPSEAMMYQHLNESRRIEAEAKTLTRRQRRDRERRPPPEVINDDASASIDYAVRSSASLNVKDAFR